ncbi:hypothetical protein KGM48_02675 [Patescibacteria group bacterium]|nr:hypothetical protein [Patescibacteria group bacterium]
MSSANSFLILVVKSIGSFIVLSGANLFDTIVFSINSIKAGDQSALPALFFIGIEFYLFFFVYRVFRMIWYLSREVPFFRTADPYFSAPWRGGKRILLIGDSTAYGTGASRPEDTLAGRLGRDFPTAEIVNKAINGSKAKSALEQLRSTEGQFDLILICTGGNDIWSYTRLATLEQHMDNLLTEAVGRSNHQVVVLFYPNFATADIFPNPLHSIMTRRSQEVFNLFSRVTSAFNVPLIDLFTTFKSRDFFSVRVAEDRDQYVAADKMHPNSEGYRLWYNRMWREMVEHRFPFVAALKSQNGESIRMQSLVRREN